MTPRSAEASIPPDRGWGLGGLLEDGRRRSRRSSFLAWMLAIVLLLVLAGALSAAGVMPTVASSRGVGVVPAETSAGSSASDARTQTREGVVAAEWEGPTTHLDWSGRSYATAEASYLGERVATPGDRSIRTLLLMNDGPSHAGLTVSLRLAEEIPSDARNPRLADDAVLFWNVGGVEGRQLYSALLAQSGGDVKIAEVQVAQGETVPVQIGFELPLATTDHRNEGHDSTALSFGVVATMAGDVSNGPDELALTGLASLLPFAVAAAGLVVLGLLFLVGRRRRRCDDCSRVVGAREPWVDMSPHGRARHRVCVECARLYQPVDGGS